MMDSFKNRKSVFLQALTYVGKLISTAIIVVLVLIGVFLIYYVISAKIFGKSEETVPKISLYTIVSGSMEPAIKVYDVILDARIDDPANLKVGDVITFKSTSSISKDMIVTHRIMDIKIVEGKYEFITKGDNNPTADSDTVKQDNLIGKTFLKIPQLGRIQFFLATKLGWFIIVLIPALGVIIYDVFKLFKILGVKGKSDSLEASDIDIKDVSKKEEDKKINETLEKIKNSGYVNQEIISKSSAFEDIKKENSFSVPEKDEPNTKSFNSPADIDKFLNNYIERNASGSKDDFDNTSK